MDLGQALLAQVALFPRLVSENISLKSFKHFDVYRPLLSISVLEPPINKFLSKLFPAITRYFVSSLKKFYLRTLDS